METRIIKCYTKDKVDLTLSEKSNGLEMVLVDDKNVAIASYVFDIEKLRDVNSISFFSNNVRIHFDDITPSTLSELAPAIE